MAYYQIQRKQKTEVAKGSRWTIIMMMLTLSFFVICVILIGATLSFATEYQNQAMANVMNISTSVHILGMMHQNQSLQNADTLIL